MAEYETLYTRPEHGTIPVKITPKGLELRRPGVKPTLHKTRVKLLEDIFGGRRGRKYAFDKYFRRGPFAPQRPEFYMPDQETLIEMGFIKRKTIGIDLEERGEEVRKLLMADFSQWIASMDMDPEEVLQEVYRGILARNRGKCPLDESKSSFGHYVHMVINGVLSNLYHKHQRITDRELVGLPDLEGQQEDASSHAVTSGDDVVQAPLWDDLKKILSDQEYVVAQMMSEGYKPQEIKAKLSLGAKQYDTLVDQVRTKVERFL